MTTRDTTQLDHYTAKLAASDVPEHLQGGLALYLAEGYQPGHFMTAVLENNLKEAVSRADDKAALGIAAVVRFLYNHAPRHAWGSPTNVTTYMELRRLERSER